MNPNLPKITHTADVCVVGGGMAGLVAAVAAARRGCSVILIHDRPVLGGNASSEIRMWICGAHGRGRKETGILEEIQLTNLYRNPSGLYSIWDAVLFEFAKLTPSLTTLLNCTCNNARMEDGHLTSVLAWQMTTQQWHEVNAKFFIDCSGDSILAPLTGAETRSGREAREEFNESIAPNRSDLKTMGNSLLLQLEETDSPQPFRAPPWAYYFDDNTPLPTRLGDGYGNNFWWIELGGLNNTIDDAEQIRDDLVKTVWGVWDYMKNRGPTRNKLTNWRIRWAGSLPGKRESRRYIGDHILTQNDVESEGKFEDIVAYGGWSMDDHHPAGLYYPGKPTVFHKAPSPYGIPFRSLYSRNVPNLLCAGRNISATHAALSSTRVMATCALMGQAVGTAAAICVAESILPRQIRGKHLKTLQQYLMDDDCWLPGLSRPVDPLMQQADMSDSCGGNLAILLSGNERQIDDTIEHWEGPVGSSITMNWTSPRQVESLRLVFDSDLNADKKLPCRYPLGGHRFEVPGTLVRAFRVEVQTTVDGWETLHEESDNYRRLVVLPVGRQVKAIRWTGLSTWGEDALRLFSIEAASRPIPPTYTPPPGKKWSDIVASLDPEDLKEPDHGLENKTAGRTRVSA